MARRKFTSLSGAAAGDVFMTKSFSSLAVAAGLLFAAACDDTATAVAPALDAVDAEFIALANDAVLGGILTGQFAALNTDELVSASDLPLHAAAAPIVTTFDFTRTAPCAAGGQVVATGEGIRTRDRDTQTMEMDVSGDKAFEGCVRVRGDLSITVNGGGTFEAFHKKVAGAWSGPQTLDQAGSFIAEASDGRVEDCDYDLSRVFDPETNQTTVTGMVCGNEIDRVMDRS